MITLINFNKNRPGRGLPDSGFVGGGGAYGGRGGRRTAYYNEPNNHGGYPYGTSLYPTLKGSGGGHCTCRTSFLDPFGHGGGAIVINASYILLEGTVCSNLYHFIIHLLIIFIND